jgi:hypothetical protein
MLPKEWPITVFNVFIEPFKKKKIILLHIYKFKEYLEIILGFF